MVGLKQPAVHHELNDARTNSSIFTLSIYQTAGEFLTLCHQQTATKIYFPKPDLPPSIHSNPKMHQ